MEGLVQEADDHMATDDLSYLVDTSLLVTDSGLHVAIYHEPPQGTNDTTQTPSVDTQGAGDATPGTSWVAQGTSQTSGPSASSGVDDFFSTFPVDKSLTLQYLTG